jgi:hypothetical protein
MNPPFSPHTLVRTTQQQVSCDLAGEAVILHLQDGVYYGLNSVGARIWSLIQAEKTVREILDILLDEYEVEPDRSEKDVLTLLHDLASRGLIEARDDQGAQVPLTPQNRTVASL